MKTKEKLRMTSDAISASQIRERLGHPIIDADGHVVEYLPTFDAYLREEGIAGGLSELMPRANFDGSPTWQSLTPEARQAQRAYRSPWWGFPMANTRDFATAHAPALLHSRLDELGIDLAVCYPSIGLQCPAVRDEELRIAACRALNRYLADQFAGYGDRLVPVAAIPTANPAEAIAELDHAVALGFKAVMIGGFAIREIPDGGPGATWIDNLGLDSVYDYDPVWEHLVALGLSAGVHSGSMGWSGRRSISNFSYNHMGNFAGANEATAKSLYLAGVPHRFPTLRLAFLEGGVTWAVQLLADLVAHWDKRGPEGLRALDPSALDPDEFDELVEHYAPLLNPERGTGAILARTYGTADVVDDYAATGVRGPADIVAQFTSSYAFGCEADDPLTSLAFDTSRIPGGAQLNALFSSDIGHWDVAEMAHVLPEVYEQIEHGWLDTDQLRAFTYDNAVRFYTDSNPDFFTGTILEHHVSEHLDASQ
jgi:predicted TIM-barrel fold metal-dependent hydrolase